jgi:hypothetical protein
VYTILRDLGVDIYSLKGCGAYEIWKFSDLDPEFTMYRI